MNSKQPLNTRDLRGFTPLILAIKLSHKDPENYYKIIELLLEAGSDPFVKDKERWTAFEEAVNLVSVRSASLLFDYMSAYKSRKILAEIQNLSKNLIDFPDCYIEIDWEFDSSVLPLVSQFAPSDKFKIWKKGSSLRLDSTLAGYKKLRVKRRNQTIIFNPKNSKKDILKRMIEAVDPAADQFSNQLERNTQYGIYLINHDKEKFTNPLEEVDLEEKRAILFDIFNSLPVQGKFKILNASFEKSLSMFGNEKEKTINGYRCKKYKLSLSLEYMLNKKNKKIFQTTKEEYFSNFREKKPGLNNSGHSEEQDTLNIAFNSKNYKLSTKKKKNKTQLLNLYISDQHEIKFKVKFF